MKRGLFQDGADWSSSVVQPGRAYILLANKQSFNGTLRFFFPLQYLKEALEGLAIYSLCQTIWIVLIVLVQISH